MPEVLMLKIALFVMPIVFFGTSLITGKPENSFHGLLQGCAFSLSMLVFAIVSWRIEDFFVAKKREKARDA